MSDEILNEVVSVIRQSPHSANSLTLYALVNTFDYEQSGCLFKLNKLRDVDAPTRSLAYRLMELMVEKGNSGKEWQNAKSEMDNLIKGG